MACCKIIYYKQWDFFFTLNKHLLTCHALNSFLPHTLFAILLQCVKNTIEITPLLLPLKEINEKNMYVSVHLHLHCYTCIMYHKNQH